MAARGDVRFELFEAEDERETLDFDILDKIIKQLEYYFGDKNLSRDKFLQRKLESGNGWVEIDVLLTFNKLRSLTYKKWTVSAAFYWKGSQLLEISRDETKVRRKPAHPWPRRSRTELDELTVFVKGFPLNTCTDELDKFFGQFGQSVDVFMMCHNKTRKFKGSVFATFATKDEVNAFLSRESVKFNELELTRAIKQTRHAIRVKKDAEYEALAEPAEELKVVPGCLLRVTGLDKVTTWKSLKEALEPYAKVAFVDYCESKGEAVLRFIEEGAAHAVLTKLEQHGKGLHIDGNRVIVEALEAGEEVEYWKKLAAIKRKLRNRRGRHNSRSVQRGKKRRSEERSISPDNMME
ncbi:la protein homolog [Rhipicephalus sanguineus]|uniref:Uncharacterized protein n=1 Tax=Rhipicephalus sanguineus TaxID=34632 RepID=A0A9D4PUZ7_RHISA|nr:la protein homolog [Rhipicephalus sanguineus]KAH7956305.1 hypothetical protein HPB52_007907 [Rhipicephalus sanguineus]